MTEPGTDITDLNSRLESLLEQRRALDEKIADMETQLEAVRQGESERLAEDGDHAAPHQSQKISVSAATPIALAATPTIVTKASSIEEKFKLFVSLFHGRPDVHARRFQSAKTGSVGYSPVCRNEFDRRYCFKGAKGPQRVRCVDCENQDFPPITLEEFTAHLKGLKSNCSDVLGAYPMDSNGLCLFIVADFDNEQRKNGEQDGKVFEAASFEAMKATALAFYKTCYKHGVQAYLELSRSGNGLHVWLFFDDLVMAQQARRLFSSILTEAMSSYSEFDLAMYDRFIPSQDSLPKSGFGNLVALPFQGRAGKDGRSLFVDEGMRPYPDQWEYLSQVEKLSLCELESIFNGFFDVSELGELLPNEEDERLGKPWEKRGTANPLRFTDFSGTVEMTYANMIHIKKEHLLPRAINVIRRLAAFKNPDFYKAQKMRLDTWNKSRIISTSEESSEYLSIPRGAKDALFGQLDDAGVSHTLDDLSTTGTPLDIDFVGALRDGQLPAAEAMLKNDIGVLSATPAFGKTVIGSYLIAKRAVSALILVHNQQLQSQWKEALGIFLDIRNESAIRLTPTGQKKEIGVIGEYGGTKKRLSGLVDVATIQSLCRDGQVKDFVKDYGLVIVDECHHVPAVSFEMVLKHINAKYVYGLTATPTRDDGHHVILFLQCGPIRYKVDAKTQAAKRPFDHYVVPRFTNMMQTSLHDENSVTRVLNDVAADSRRNKMIADDITEAIKVGRNPIVLTERTEHVALLSRLLAGTCDNVITLVGGMGIREKRKVNDRLSQLNDDERFVIIATGKYVGEGFDFPRLDTLFLAMPIAWKGKVAQYTGRLHRLYEGKEDVLVYDYVDVNIPVLERMYYKRIKGYRAVGYRTLTQKQGVDIPNFIFDQSEYWNFFKSDLASAKKEIVISSPTLVTKRIADAVRTIASKFIEDAVIRVVTRPARDYRERMRSVIAVQIKRLKDSGVQVIEQEGLHQRFAVIDQNTVWYGGISPLGYSTKDDSIMRLEDGEVALALLRGLQG